MLSSPPEINCVMLHIVGKISKGPEINCVMLHLIGNISNGIYKVVQL